jgi:hypothetical protein
MTVVSRGDVYTTWQVRTICIKIIAGYASASFACDPQYLPAASTCLRHFARRNAWYAATAMPIFSFAYPGYVSKLPD